jgi:hypothetical protein
MKSRALVVASLLVLAGCGGGGGGSTPVPHPTVAPSSSPTGSYKNMATLTLSIPLPASPSSTKRNPQYVSPSTTTLNVMVNSVNGQTGAAIPGWVTPNPQIVDLTQPGLCTTSDATKTCTISTIPAPPGTVNYTFTVTDGTNALATFTGDENITQGASNNLNVTLQGIVKTVSVTGISLVAGTAFASQALTVSALDAGGNVILSPGAYSNAITLTDNDATGVTSLAVNGGASSSTVTVSNPSDVVTLAYTGQATNNFTITASGSGITGGGPIAASVSDVVFTGTTDDTASVGGLSADPNYGQQTVFFSSLIGTQTISASEFGWTGAPINKTFAIDASNCAGKATVAPGTTANTFVVTPVANGICKVKLNESGTGYPLTNHTANATGSETHDGTFWVSVTTVSGVFN